MHIRNFTWDDFPALIDLMNAYQYALGSARQITREQIEPGWRSPYNHPERDCFVAVDVDGALIGFTIADLLDDPARANGVYTVLPGQRAAGEALIHAASDHFLRMAREKNDPGAALTMEWRISDKDTDASALLEAEGYAHVRTFYTMRITLDQPIAPLPLPEGFTRRPFTAEDLEAVYKAKSEAFLDHWGEEDQPLEEWRADIQRPGFDPSLWWIACSGDEIAGMALSQPTGPETAWVGIVGVRRPWRRQGLAYALLRQCFAEYQRRGWRHVDLGVDSDSSTQAVALYERAGMHVRARQLYYRREFAV